MKAYSVMRVFGGSLCKLHELAQQSSNLKDDEKRNIHECIMNNEGSSMLHFNHIHDQAADESCDQ